MTLTTSVIIIGVAAICEFIDSSLGMLYGTILSPLLILAGFDPILVVPSILFSQALGGFTASIIHQRLKNVNFGLKSRNPRYIKARITELGYKEAFNRGTTPDLKVSIYVISLGIIVTVLSALVAVNIPKIVLKTYIGILVLLMGIIILSNVSFKFSWRKMIGVGMLSAFNKAMSGGGFGPVVTAGQIIGGRDGKESIGSTTLAEAPICITGFLVYLLTTGISSWNLVLILTIGSMIGALIGPFFTARFKSGKKLKFVLGILAIFLGIWVLANTWFLKIKGVSA